MNKKEMLEYVVPGAIVESARLLSGNATMYYDTDDGGAVVQHFKTAVVTIRPDGSVVLNSGGWRTLTTKERINRFLPPGWMLYARQHRWLVSRGYGKRPDEREFMDGMWISQDGSEFGYPEGADDKERERIQMKKRIMTYARGFQKHMKENGVPMPEGGDCWMCSMFNSQDTDHLIQHMDEEYYFGWLIFRALEWKGYKDPGLIMIGWSSNEASSKYLADAVRKYLYRKLGVC